MSKRYYTVVYEIADEEAFQRVMGAANGAMETGTGMIPGVKVTGCGNGDTMTSYDALAELAMELGYDADDVVREYCDDNELDADATIG